MAREKTPPASVSVLSATVMQITRKIPQLYVVNFIPFVGNSC